jgi:hypothetical protein
MGLTRINRREEEMRYRIDREQLSDFLARQVRLVERLPVEAAEAAADGYGDGLDDAEVRRSGWQPGSRRSSARRLRTSRSGSSSPRATAAQSREEEQTR